MVFPALQYILQYTQLQLEGKYVQKNALILLFADAMFPQQQYKYLINTEPTSLLHFYDLFSLVVFGVYSSAMPIRLCQTAAILSRETKKALFYHA